jgi:multidrug resistance efflux pump
MSRPSTTRRTLWLLGLILLAASTPAAAFLFNYSATGSSLTAVHPTAGSTDSSDSAGVVCFGQVDLKYGVTALFPLQPGRVEKVLVEEGQTVEKGTVLLQLEEETARSREKEAQLALEAAQLRLKRAEKLPDQHTSRLHQQQDAIEAMEERLSAARHQLSRQEELVRAREISASDVASSKDHVRELEAMVRVEKLRLKDLQDQDPKEDLREASKQVEIMKVRCEQARQALEECKLKAPQRGTVLRILTGPGDVLSGQSKQPAIQFATDGPLVVRADVEQEFIGRVQRGQSALVGDTTQGTPVYPGEVERVSNWMTQRRSIMQGPMEFSDVRTVEALITLEGKPPLRIGQRVRVRIGAVESH